jgi:hypothetical protein
MGFLGSFDATAPSDSVSAALAIRVALVAVASNAVVRSGGGGRAARESRAKHSQSSAGCARQHWRMRGIGGPPAGAAGVVWCARCAHRPVGTMSLARPVCHPATQAK